MSSVCVGCLGGRTAPNERCWGPRQPEALLLTFSLQFGPGQIELLDFAEPNAEMALEVRDSLESLLRDAVEEWRIGQVTRYAECCWAPARLGRARSIVACPSSSYPPNTSRTLWPAGGTAI